MKVLILAAGYGTRLHPLTKNLAKPLIKIGNKTILEHIVKKIEKVQEIDEISQSLGDFVNADQLHEFLGQGAGHHQSDNIRDV